MLVRPVTRRSRLAAVLIGAALVVGACGGGDDDAAPAAGGGPVTVLTISGNPATTAMQGQSYSFTPTAADPNNAALTFSIANKPAWATFNTTTGRLSGTPTSGDLGTYASIQVSVSNGSTTTNLATFSIQVVAMTTSSASLSWTPPTQNSDGSALTNLSGYKVYWGTTQGSYPNSAPVGNNVTTHMVSNLTPATWYFTVTALNSQGVESSFSNVAQKTVQ